MTANGQGQRRNARRDDTPECRNATQRCDRCNALLCRFESPCHFTRKILRNNNSNYQSANIINCEVAVSALLHLYPIIDEHSDLLLAARLGFKIHLDNEHTL